MQGDLANQDQMSRRGHHVTAVGDRGGEKGRTERKEGNDEVIKAINFSECICTTKYRI